MVGKAPSKMDLVFIVDCSTTIDDSDWHIMTDFVRTIIGSVDIGPDGVHVGLVRFSKTANVEFYLIDHMNGNALKERVGNIARIEVREGTNITDGLIQANILVFNAVNGARNDVPWVAIVLTDGRGNENVSNTLPMAAKLKLRNVTIITVGITQHVDTNMLSKISSDNRMMTSPNCGRLFRFLPGATSAYVVGRRIIVSSSAPYVRTSIAGKHAIFVLDCQEIFLDDLDISD